MVDGDPSFHGNLSLVRSHLPFLRFSKLEISGLNADIR